MEEVLQQLKGGPSIVAFSMFQPSGGVGFLHRSPRSVVRLPSPQANGGHCRPWQHEMSSVALFGLKMIINFWNFAGLHHSQTDVEIMVSKSLSLQMLETFLSRLSWVPGTSLPYAIFRWMTVLRQRSWLSIVVALERPHWITIPRDSPFGPWKHPKMHRGHIGWGPPDMWTLVYQPWNITPMNTSSLYLPFLATEMFGNWTLSTGGPILYIKCSSTFFAHNGTLIPLDPFP